MAAAAGMMFALFTASAGTARAGMIVDVLKTAGPGYWALLAGPNAKLSMSGPGTSFGNVGFANGSGEVKLSTSGTAPVPNMGIVGDLYLAPGAEIDKPEKVDGNIIPDYTGLTTAWTDATNASTYFSSLSTSPNMLFTEITAPVTLNRTGAVTVITVNTINLNSETITLNGDPGDQFVINITNEFKLGSGSKIVLSGGLRAYDVVYNLTGSKPFSTSGGLGNNLSEVTGIVMALNTKIQFSPGKITGSLIAGDDIAFASGASVTGVPPASEVPEGSTMVLMGSGFAVLAWVNRKRKPQSV